MGSTSADKRDDHSSPSIKLVKKKFTGKYAISAEEFTNDTVCAYKPYPACSFEVVRQTKFLIVDCLNVLQVGAKSRNIAYLKEKAPSWIGIPTSVALPFGVFEKVLSDPINKVSFLS